MTWTELHEACDHQDDKTVLDLLNHGKADQAYMADAHGLTPLHILIWRAGSSPNTVSAVQAAIQANPQALTDQDVHGDTPLSMACRSPQADKHIVHLLLEACPTSASMANREGLMPLHTACRYAPQNEGVIGLLVEAYPYALRSHIKIGDPAPTAKTIEPLAERKGTDHFIVDPTGGMATKDFTDLRFNGENQQIRDGAYPLHMAIAANAPLSVIEMLIKEAPDVLVETNKFGETPLHVALVHEASEELVEVLLKYGKAAVRVREKKFSNLPVHSAASVGCNVHVAKDLIETWPESIHEKNKGGLTPLDVARSNGKCSEDVLLLFQMSDTLA